MHCGYFIPCNWHDWWTSLTGWTQAGRQAGRRDVQAGMMLIFRQAIWQEWCSGRTVDPAGMLIRQECWSGRNVYPAGCSDWKMFGQEWCSGRNDHLDRIVIRQDMIWLDDYPAGMMLVWCPWLHSYFCYLDRNFFMALPFFILKNVFLHWCSFHCIFLLSWTVFESCEPLSNTN